jgi:hypothetical protein
VVRTSPTTRSCWRAANRAPVAEATTGTSNTVTAHAKIALIARDAAGRWFAKVKAGDEFFHLTQRWHRLFRRIDRNADRYSEHITDAKTGAVIRSVEEPLSEHQGHGSAKKIPPPSEPG